MDNNTIAADVRDEIGMHVIMGVVFVLFVVIPLVVIIRFAQWLSTDWPRWSQPWSKLVVVAAVMWLWLHLLTTSVRYAVVINAKPHPTHCFLPVAHRSAWTEEEHRTDGPAPADAMITSRAVGEQQVCESYAQGLRGDGTGPQSSDECERWVWRDLVTTAYRMPVWTHHSNITVTWPNHLTTDQAATQMESVIDAKLAELGRDYRLLDANVLCTCGHREWTLAIHWTSSWSTKHPTVSTRARGCSLCRGLDVST